jgi:hypothetical protein
MTATRAQFIINTTNSNNERRNAISALKGPPGMTEAEAQSILSSPTATEAEKLVATSALERVKAAFEFKKLLNKPNATTNDTTAGLTSLMTSKGGRRRRQKTYKRRKSYRRKSRKN